MSNKGESQAEENEGRVGPSWFLFIYLFLFFWISNEEIHLGSRKENRTVTKPTNLNSLNGITEIYQNNKQIYIGKRTTGEGLSTPYIAKESIKPLADLSTRMNSTLIEEDKEWISLK